MPLEPVLTKEIASLPDRPDEAHKGEVGRIAVVGGCEGRARLMLGAPALVASAALRGGAGLVQVYVPESLRTATVTISPCATARTLPKSATELFAAVTDFGADVVAFGPGLGDSLPADAAIEFLNEFPGPVVLDADGLNLLAASPDANLARADRFVLTPHPGEMRRLLESRNIETPTDRQAAAIALVQRFGCTVVLKGHRSVVTDGRRIYVNETGNAGMATGGAGDVLTGLIAALIGQKVPILEAAILGVYLHGLAGDFAAEELGRWSLTATDLIDYLPEAFCEHEVAQSE